MEKTFKFFISFMFGEFNKNQEEPYKILENKEYTFLSFNQEKIKNPLKILLYKVWKVLINPKK